MATCPFCRLQTFQLEDRYCTLCKKPLCRLVLRDGMYIELPEDASGTIEQDVVVRNAGHSLLVLAINDLVDPAVRLASEERVLPLDPYAAETTIKFSIDAGTLQRREDKVGLAEFSSSDPELEKGIIRFGIADPAAIAVESTGIDLKELATSGPGADDRHKQDFAVLVTNRGGRKVQVTLQGGRQDHPIQVAFAKGESFEVEGYSQSVPIPLVAWTSVEREKVVDAFMLTFQSKDTRDKGSDSTIEIRAARCAHPPQIEVKPLEFSDLAPGQSPQPGSGQTRIGWVEIQNRGSSVCRITEVSSDSNLIRLLTDLPVDVKPGPTSTRIEFVMSTRASGEHIHENTRLPINLWFKTNSVHVGDVFVPGVAQLTVPSLSRGLMAVDFGTINSCVAYIRGMDAEPELVADEETKTGEKFIASMMIFVAKLHRYEDWLLHGLDVKDGRAYVHPGGVIHSVKRAIEREQWRVYDSEYSGTQLATWIIEQLLLESGRRHNCRPQQVAMTIPAAFWGPRRTAMLTACKEACRLAWGTEVMNPTPIDEATAAAMYFYFKNPRPVAEQIEGKGIFLVLVFDFGGGTLDISVVEFAEDERGILNVQPIIARGDNHMGGIDLDLELVRALAGEAKKQHPEFPEEAISASRWEFNRRFERRKGFGLLQAMRVTWYQKAKELKETLTSKPVASFSCEPLYDVNGNELINDDGSRREVRCEVSRDEFETMIAGRVDRAAHLVTSTLESLSLSPQDIGTVLLTGQSSQIPCFQRAIRKIFSHLPPEMQNTTMPLKESVAAGAAWAAMAQATNHVKLGRLDRTSYRYGIDGSWTSEASKGFVELIPLNSIFGQRKEHVKLLLAEGEHGFREMRIIQNGTQSDRVPDGTDPDVTIIGKIDLSGYPPGEIDFSLFFSTDTGMLTAEVNHQEVKIQPILDEASEAVYL